MLARRVVRQSFGHPRSGIDLVFESPDLVDPSIVLHVGDDEAHHPSGLQVEGHLLVTSVEGDGDDVVADDVESQPHQFGLGLGRNPQAPDILSVVDYHHRRSGEVGESITCLVYTFCHLAHFVASIHKGRKLVTSDVDFKIVLHRSSNFLQGCQYEALSQTMTQNISMIQGMCQSQKMIFILILAILFKTIILKIIKDKHIYSLFILCFGY